MDQINAFLNNPLVILAALFLLSVVAFVIWQRLGRRDITLNPPKAQDPVDLMIAGRRAIKSAAEIRGAARTLDILADHTARKDMAEVAEALQGGVFDPCETIQALARHANAVAPPPAAPAAPQSCPVK